VVVVVVDVSVDVSGALSSSVAHEAVSTTIAVIAVPPAKATTRRARGDFMVMSLLVRVN
jgi:hypothetical protein